MTKRLGADLSSNVYISIQLRGSDLPPNALKVVHPRNCNHGGQSGDEDGTACETAQCLNSWSLDHIIYLHRTKRGRRIVSRFHLTDDDVSLLANVDFRPSNPQYDPFRPEFDIS